MGGKSSSNSFSICNIFKVCFSVGSSRDDDWDEGDNVRRLCPSDEDRWGWTAEPGIDCKATAYIDRFYAARVSESEHHSCAP